MIICLSFQLFEHCLAPDTMNDGTGMDNMTAVIVKLRSTFKGNKSAKNLLAGGSSGALSGENSTSTCSSLANAVSTHKENLNLNSVSANGNGKLSVSAKRLNENSGDSSNSDTPSKKNKLDEDKSNSASVTPV